MSTEHINAGLRRIQTMSAKFSTETIHAIASHERSKNAANQPWFVAGCSDGIGLHTAVAAIDAGILKFGLGVYWEPPHFLELGEDGTPVSPVHYARMQNAMALEVYAKSKGASFKVISANVILAPKRDLKGNIKEEAPQTLDAELMNAFEAVRKMASTKDAIFINSVAFGKWISPREGEAAIEVPSLTFDGEIVMMKTKTFHARGYQETLDTMGRNHNLLLQLFKRQNWFGEKSLTSFYTWAGGSQNVDVLRGIYGYGALGDAKIIAESDVAAFRLAHGMTLGSHAIVRLPAFLSAALMGIPGGGMFGMISRSFLEARGLFEDMPRLAERAIDRMFGPHWVRENPIAQVEVDTSECLYIDDIHANVKELQRRVDAHIKTAGHPGQDPFDLQTSRTLLDGLVPNNYTDVLLRFHPNQASTGSEDPITKPMTAVPSAPAEDSGPVEAIGDGKYTFTLHSERLGGLGDVPHPDLTIVAALKRMSGLLDDQLDPLTFDTDELTIERALPEHSTTVSAKIAVVGAKQRVTIQREYFDIDGERIAVGMATFVDQLRSTGTVTVEDNLLGEPIGYRMPVRERLELVYGAADNDIFHGPALMSFAHRSLSAHGFFDEEVLPTTWTTRFGGSVEIGDHLHTFARKDSGGLVVTVVNDASFPVLQMRMGE